MVESGQEQSFPGTVEKTTIGKSNKFGEINDKDWLNRFEENYYDDFDEGKKSPIDYYNNPN